MVTRIIDVRHLLDAGSGGLDEDTLVELITTCVEPDMWDETGGPGTQKVFRGLLVFRQNYEISRQVQALVDAISEHCLRPLANLSDSVDPAAVGEPVWVGLSGEERQIIARLNEPASVQVTKGQVKEAVLSLCQRHGIPVVSFGDWASWAIDPFAPTFGIDVDVDNEPLWKVLERLTGGSEYIWVTHGVLFISRDHSPDFAPLARLYPLRLPKSEDGPQHANQVADLFVERLEPDAWSDNGGYGLVEQVNNEWLLVVQTLPMHRRVEEALAKLRAGEMLPVPPKIPDGSWEFRSSPAIGALWRLMRRMVPGAGGHDAE